MFDVGHRVERLSLGRWNRVPRRTPRGPNITQDGAGRTFDGIARGRTIAYDRSQIVTLITQDESHFKTCLPWFSAGSMLIEENKESCVVFAKT